jgi:uncharacterized protein YjdB
LERLRQATQGDFVVERELGRGGMAAVYLAHDMALNRKVAIKVMSPGLLMGPGMVQRFRQEAVTVANLSHPHIITIHAVRQVAGLHFFVMKLIRGRSLERIIREDGPLPSHLAQAILFQVGSALWHAHRRGVIHRDVKPANILMDEDGSAIVTDFGIAKVRESTTHTSTGATVGTPVYMSPEQCWSREVTDSSDQYSLGIVAYEMLTGAPPFTGPNLGILRAHVEDTPPPLVGARPDCPADVAMAIARMLLKEPGNRWPDIMQAVTALGGRHLPEHDPLRHQLAGLAMKAAPARAAPLRAPIDSVPTTLPPPRASPIAAVVVSASRSSAPVGESVQLYASGRDAAGSDIPGAKISWTSSDPTIATISGAGVVTPRSPGTVTITASADDGVDAVTVLEVTPPAPAVAATSSVPPAPIVVTNPVATLAVEGIPSRWRPGDQVRLAATARDNSGAALADRLVRWSSLAPGVVAVAGDGTVAALAEGVATIVASCEGQSATIEIRVDPALVAAVVVQPPTRPLRVGRKLVLRAEPRDQHGGVLRGRTIEWSSRNPAIAEIDSVSGALRAVAPGSAVLLATCEAVQGETTLEVTAAGPAVDLRRFWWAGGVAVLALGVWLWARGGDRGPVATPVAALSLAPSSGDLKVGDTVRLTASFLAADGSTLPPQPILWRSSDSSVVTVSREGLASAIRPGLASITGTGAGHEQSASFRVLAAPVGTRGSIELSGARPEVLVRDSFTLRARVLDELGAEITDAPVQWRSSRPAVATVSEAGAVEALTEGSTTITAESEDRTASLEIRVTGLPVGSVAVSPSAYSLSVGDSVRLTAMVRSPAGDTLRGKVVVWDSNQPRVVTVSPRGQASAVAPGQATVTATSGGVRGTAVLTVGARRETVARVAIQPISGNLEPGKTVKLTAEVRSNRGAILTDRVVIWHSSRPEIATVEAQAGALTPRAAGRAQITATIEGASDTLTITVAPATASSGLEHRGPRFQSLAMGGFSCAVDEAGAAHCWGQGVPQPTRVGGPPLGQVTVGLAYACGLTPAGQAYCWGSNGKGQLGDGTTKNRSAPRPVAADLRFTMIAAGEVHACGLTSDSKVYCWGGNGYGQLGDGSTDRRTRPAQIRESQSWRMVAAGGKHSCAVTTRGTAFCWGDGSWGELGQGATQSSLVPVRVAGALSFTSLAAGRQHTCGLTSIGEVYCWGANRDGQLGNNDREDANRPTRVVSSEFFESLSAAATHTCALSAGGYLHCWGSNSAGQLGTGRGPTRFRPARVKGDLVFTEVRAGATHTCALTREQRVLCWGGNERGQLGDGTLGSRFLPGPVRP